MMATLPAHDDAWSEPRGMVADPEQINAWAQISKPGDRMVYATRTVLPRGSAGAAAARRLEAAGLAYLTRKRSDLLAGEWNYLIERSSKPWPAATAVRPARALLAAVAGDVDPDIEQLAVDRMLPVLERVAQFGRPCPTDKQLAERVGMLEATVPAALDALRALNLIRVHAASAPTLRRVTIVRTGARTGFVA